MRVGTLAQGRQLCNLYKIGIYRVPNLRGILKGAEEPEASWQTQKVTPAEGSVLRASCYNSLKSITCKNAKKKYQKCRDGNLLTGNIHYFIHYF